MRPLELFDVCIFCVLGCLAVRSILLNFMIDIFLNFNKISLPYEEKKYGFNGITNFLLTEFYNVEKPKLFFLLEVEKENLNLLGFPKRKENTSDTQNYLNDHVKPFVSPNFSFLSLIMFLHIFCSFPAGFYMINGLLPSTILSRMKMPQTIVP